MIRMGVPNIIKVKVYEKAECLLCKTEFDLTRKDKKFCSRKCQSHAARDAKVKEQQAEPKKAKKRLRVVENKVRNEEHYSRSAWLTYDVYRLPEPKKTEMVQRLLEAASSHDAKLRNILLDPTLLGSDRHSSVGRHHSDMKMGIPNIAKQVYSFCMLNYGCSTKECILDNRKPAFRQFVGDPVVGSKKQEAEIKCQHFEISGTLTGKVKQAYDEMLTRKIAEFEVENKMKCEDEILLAA